MRSLRLRDALLAAAQEKRFELRFGCFGFVWPLSSDRRWIDKRNIQFRASFIEA